MNEDDRALPTPNSPIPNPSSFILRPVLGHQLFDFGLQLFVADGGHAVVLFVLVADPAGDLVDLHHTESLVALEAEELVDPKGHAVGAALVGQGHAGWTTQERGGVEDVVDPLVGPQPARVDPGG